MLISVNEEKEGNDLGTLEDSSWVQAHCFGLIQATRTQSLHNDFINKCKSELHHMLYSCNMQQHRKCLTT